MKIIITAVLATFAILALSLATLYWLGSRDGSYQSAPTGKVKVEGFNADGRCAAIMPTCGYCPGEKSQEECYLTQEEEREYKKYYPDLKTSL